MKFKYIDSMDEEFTSPENKKAHYTKHIEKRKEFEYTSVILGDTTGDGVVDVGDVAKLYQHLRGGFDMEREFKLASDVYDDSILELNDVDKLYQYVRHGIESLEG